MFKKQFAYVADLAPVSIEKCLLKSKKGLEAKGFFFKVILDWVERIISQKNKFYE